MSILNKFFERVFCITRPQDKDRQKKCVDQFVKYGIDFEWMPSVDASFLRDIPVKEGTKGVSTPELSLTIAHMMCLQKAQLNGWTKIAIFEDDFSLYEDWELRFEYFCSELPSVWKILYLGQPEWVDGIFDTKRVPYTKNVDICKYGSASHFLGFHESVYADAIRRMNTLCNPVDIYYGDIMWSCDECFTPTEKSLANAISLPHKNYHSRIKNFEETNYIPSCLRDACLNP